MQLAAGQVISVTNVDNDPHEGIVSLPCDALDVADVMKRTRVIHFCRGDPDQSFPDGTGTGTAAGDPDSERRVRETSLAWFVSHGRDPRIVGGPPSPFSPDRVVSNARGLLGARGQSLASHCYYGDAVGSAVRTGGYVVGAALVVAAGAVVYVANHLARAPERRAA